FLNKKALVGDAIAHAVLPGICLGFILAGTKNPVILIAGAFATGWISVVLVDLIHNKSKLKEDTAIGLILSVFFGFGVLLLTIIQKSGNAAQSGLDHFLFGKAASLVGQDLLVFGVVAVLLLIMVYLFFKEFSLLAFDKDFAISIGLPVKSIQLVLTSLVVLAVVIGIQAVGVVLMAAMLITPAAAARFWTDKINTMIFLACLFGAFSGLAGAYISFIAPAMPTGPWIVIVISSIALLSFFLAPKKGIITRFLSQRKVRLMMQEENVLKALYHLGETDKDFFKQRGVMAITQKRHFDLNMLERTLQRLLRQGYLTKSGSSWQLTREGKEKGQRIVKLHRLWELYLTTYLRIAPDHVHDDAETIEHFLTPELEAMLEEKLNYPKFDPHEEKIPYKSQ
ncbi:MAG TPA: iron chelate uptake ABC transporter family permease subunit, partial [Cyclobacteriaceae bacterium]|nr:iron chelate uptake ABC transporter family permease subunit [Cyclobacteriaceae bacterium]